MSTNAAWEGSFGNAYNERNRNLVENNLSLFREVFVDGDVRKSIQSILEFGAGTGMNTQALRQIFPHAIVDGVEINMAAAAELEKVASQVYHTSATEFDTGRRWTLTMTKGLLIHIHPDLLPHVYYNLYRHATKYVLIAEYHNPTPVEVTYRGRQGLLWKRDFAADMISRYPDLNVINYGFRWKYDRYPQDDLTYYLMEKQG